MKGKLTAKGYLTELNFGKTVYMHNQIFAEGKIWSFGGNTSTSVTSTNTKDIRTYDVTTNEWKMWTDNNMPTRIKLSATAYHNGLIYFFGGVVSSNTNSNYTYSYEIATGTWTRLADIPTTFKYRSALVRGNEIWVVGGTNTVIYIYNIEENTFKTLSNASKPTATHQTSVAVGEKIYTFAGTTMYIYDIAGNTYATRVLPTTVYGHAFAYNIDKSIYLINPLQESLTTLSGFNVYEYDPNTDTFSLVQTVSDSFLLDNSMQNTTCLRDGNKLYFFAKTKNHTTFQPMCFSYHIYVTNQEHIIETTDANQVTNVAQIQDIEIAGEEPEYTKLRFALSFDGRKTYHKFDGAEWVEIQKTDVLISGNTMEELMAITTKQFDLILQGVVRTINFVIGMETSDEEVSPKLKFINIVKLEK